MMIRVLAVLAFLAAATPAITTKAMAAKGDAIGSLMAVEGAVTVKRAGTEKAQDAATAMPVHLNDVIETGPAGRAVAVFADQTVLTLGADAQVTIDEYVFEPAAKSGNRARMNVARGAFLYVSGLIGKQARPDVEIKIPYGAIGLRGTTVWGGQLDQYGVFVLDGKVSVQTKRGSMMLGKGEGVDLANINAAPSARKTWGQPKIDRAVATVTLAKAEDADKRVQEELTRLRAAHEKIEAPAPKKEELKQPENPNITPEAPAPEKKTDNGFGEEEGGAEQLKKARSALEDRREELQPAPAPVAPAPAP